MKHVCDHEMIARKGCERKMFPLTYRDFFSHIQKLIPVEIQNDEKLCHLEINSYST